MGRRATSEHSIRNTLTRDCQPDSSTRQAARLTLATRALDQDDPAGWLRDLIDALGLRER